MRRNVPCTSLYTLGILKTSKYSTTDLRPCSFILVNYFKACLEDNIMLWQMPYKTVRGGKKLKFTKSHIRTTTKCICLYRGIGILSCKPVLECRKYTRNTSILLSPLRVQEYFLSVLPINCFRVDGTMAHAYTLGCAIYCHLQSFTNTTLYGRLNLSLWIKHLLKH